MPRRFLRVLVADDDRSNRAIVSLALRAARHDVIECAEGTEACRRLLTERFDLAILDIRMPGASGLEILRRLRSEPQGAHLPVLCLSALASRDDIALGLAAGADAYLTKPFRPKELMAAIESVLLSPDSCG